MEKDIFEFKSYKQYLIYHLGTLGRRKGLKSALAKAINCQPTYISQILNGHAQMSLEQAEAANRFLNHTEEESHFFLLLVQFEKAGTKPLANYFNNQLQRALNERMVLTKRVGKAKVLSKIDQSEYYSSWTYAAIHIATTISELNSPNKIASFFNLNIQIVNKVLSFLINRRLISKGPDGSFDSGDVTVRLGNNSPNIIKHHTNWRLFAIDALEKETINDLHYSGIVSLSEKDAFKIKDSIKVIKDSKEEELFCLNLDFFNTKK